MTQYAETATETRLVITPEEAGKIVEAVFQYQETLRQATLMLDRMPGDPHFYEGDE